MITLIKSLALVAMQASLQAKNLAHVVSFCGGNKYLKVNDESLLCIFSDNSCLLVTVLDDSDEQGHNLAFNIDFSLEFIAFCLLLSKESELDIAEAEDLFCKTDYFKGSQKEFYDYLVEYYYNNYHSLSNIINFVDNEAYLYDGCLRDCAEEFINDTQDISQMGTLANYIDYDSYGEDMVLNSEWEKINNQLIWMNPRDL